MEITQKVVHLLSQGKIVILPTDTLYGILCRADSEPAVRRLYKIRKTPLTKPSLILAADIPQAKAFGSFNQAALKLAAHFWPGPLTIVVRNKERLPTIIRGSADTIGVRVPNVPYLLEIIATVGVPVVAPSANFHGEKPPASFTEIDSRLLSLVDYSIDLERLPIPEKLIGKPSTIVDTVNKPCRILREGAVSARSIAKILSEEVL